MGNHSIPPADYAKQGDNLSRAAAGYASRTTTSCSRVLASLCTVVAVLTVTLAILLVRYL